MTELQFCYWLQGFAELAEDEPTVGQWETIKEHLALVFLKVTLDKAPLVTSPSTFPPAYGPATC